MLRRGNAASDAPASRNAGALPDEFPRRSVNAVKLSASCLKNWSAIASAIAVKKTAKAVLLQLYA